MYHLLESTLLNFNSHKIKGGIFANFPANEKKEGYIGLMREKKESFLENESALKGLLASDLQLTGNTINYLSKTYLNTDIIRIQQ